MIWSSHALFLLHSASRLHSLCFLLNLSSYRLRYVVVTETDLLQ